ncbi:DUF5060 domain-containing protein [Crateriforma conspicua]|uniref:Putative endoglucanase n=1 Tax=Crateriforma conspicua TaxID=2527996 RepID=A0A5C5Y1S8_9PLAN|nr:DUF5060 domain-containing protein [Crateriforma conspicua]TWT68789.1 putative endoglucanase [Crateriforma conspicua]
MKRNALNTVYAAITFLLVSLAMPHSVLAINRVDYQEGAVAGRQWEVLDIAFATATAPQQANEIEIAADFTGPDGTEIAVDGFDDGDGRFVIRFTPTKPGSWTFNVRSSVAALDGKQGSLSVQPAGQDRKGGVVIAKDSPTRFEYENGERYYPIAFECDWLFALDAENPDDIPQTRRFVDTLAENGFNQVVMNVFAYDVNWPKDDRLVKEFDYGSPDVYPFGGHNENPDHSRLNIEYFQRLDRVIDYLDQKGIVAHLMIYVWNKNVNWPEADSQADNRYFDYVVRRYQAFPNMVWDISKEALGYGHNDVNYISHRIDRLRKADAYRRLVTVHDYAYCRRFPEKVDFVSVQLWLSELYSVMRDVVKNIPGKPILNIEHGGYERGPYVVFTGNYTSPEVCLERAYQCVFAGTFPTHYWQGAAWNVIIPDIKTLPADEQPRLDYYRHMRSFVDRYRVDELVAGDRKANAGFCLHDNADTLIYYIPKECDFIGVRLPSERRGETMTATWFDPYTGEYSKPENHKITQWPSLKVPAGDGLRILVLNLDTP